MLCSCVTAYLQMISRHPSASDCTTVGTASSRRPCCHHIYPSLNLRSKTTHINEHKADWSHATSRSNSQFLPLVTTPRFQLQAYIYLCMYEPSIVPMYHLKQTTLSSHLSLITQSKTAHVNEVKHFHYTFQSSGSTFSALPDSSAPYHAIVNSWLFAT